MKNTEAIDSRVRHAFEVGDEAAFLRYAKAFKALTGNHHPYWEKYLQEIEEAHALTRICTRASIPSLCRG